MALDDRSELLNRARRDELRERASLAIVRLRQRIEAVEELHDCPCCGYLTLVGFLDICSLCGWQDDGQDDPAALEVRGGPNQDLSLDEARKNFARHGAMYRADDEQTCIELELCNEKRVVIADFDAALEAPSDNDVVAALCEALNGMRSLSAHRIRLSWEQDPR